MTELVVLSGKGGTGKTSLVASFAALAGGAVLADCDVDAPDLHLVTDVETGEEHPFASGRRAVVDPGVCTGCGDCLPTCRFGALRLDRTGCAAVDPFACEGCGVCVHVCPASAVRTEECIAGSWLVSRTRFGPLVHARLRVGGASSGKLVALVRRQARQLAQLEHRDLILVDGPPGVGCPVISSLTGADALLVVTEPTPSGEHDLARVLELARHFDLPAGVCVNRWDLHPPGAARIRRLCGAVGVPVVGQVRYDPGVTAAQVAGRPVVEHGGPAAADVRTLWRELDARWLRTAAGAVTSSV